MKITKFIISGGAAAFVEFVIFLMLRMLLGESGLFFAQTVSFLAGFVVSFSLNRKWVFKSRGKLLPELSKYIALLVINVVLTNVVLFLLVNSGYVVYWLAKIMVMAMVAIWNYFIFQKIIFKQN